ncbi:MAG: 4Fe-4S binding protein [Bacteroidales bacterium]|nr:4Fe-4S binding protein [Bacteroidales bacterium]
MIIVGIGSKGGIGITTFLSHLYHDLHHKNNTAIWFSLSSYVPLLLQKTENQWNNYNYIYKKVPSWKKIHCLCENKCLTACQYGAITRYGNNYFVYSELCNSCGTCVYVCPKKEINLENQQIAVVEKLNEHNIFRIKLSLNEILSKFNLKLISDFILEIFSGRLVFIDMPSGNKELWDELVRLSDYIVLFISDYNLWEIYYKNLFYNIKNVFLLCPDYIHNEFLKRGFSYAIPIPFTKKISSDILKGLYVSDETYKKQINFVLSKIQI